MGDVPAPVGVMGAVRRVTARDRAAFLVPAVLLATASLASAQSTQLDLPSPYVSGYARPVRGEVLNYHSPIRTDDRSLLVRSLDRARDIAWETAPVPDGFEGDTAVFVFMVGLDVHEEPRAFDLFVNGRALLTFRNPTEAARGVLEYAGDEGVRIEFRVTELDKYGDAMGFMFLRLPRTHWEASRSAELRVAGESAGARTWFMVFQERIGPRVTLRNAPALIRTPRGPEQVVQVDVLQLEWAGHLAMSSPIGTLDTALAIGLNRFQIPVPEVQEATPVPIRVRTGGSVLETTFPVLPVRPIEVYLIHHTHLDIGYTHHQDDVERLQWEHLENAVRYGAASAGFPEGSRFVWNPEGLWPVETYLEEHTAEENARLRAAVRAGAIHLDALYANPLTGIQTDEGLMRTLDAARRLSAWSGVPIRTAMLSDIPGFTWGLVTALGQHGVEFLSIGPNFGHRIGHFSEALGDRPFWWESPSGEERVLTWVSGAGYAWFHTGLGYENITTLLTPESVFRYVDRLVDAEYPYDITYLRYNIGSDNGPPDPGLAEAVRAWNERYLSPRIVIAGTTRLFEEFAARYGDTLPVWRGDLTGHWEDGAASSARETALARRAAEVLVQTEALAAMRGVAISPDALRAAWRSVVLFDEHTWGAWNSISEPEAEFVRAQWATKRGFADSAWAQAGRLRDRVVAGQAGTRSPGREILVANTLNWLRTEVVVLPPTIGEAGDRVVDAAGRAVPSQRLASGGLAFLAADVPGLGWKRFRIEPGPASGEGDARADGAVISNALLRVEVDPERGVVRSLRVSDGSELAGPQGLGRYVYVAGRDPADSVQAGPMTATVVDRGPLVASLRLEGAAPGAREIVTAIRVVSGSDRVEIAHTIDKALVYEPEAVLYRYDFALDGTQARVDVPWGSYSAADGQLPGGNRNYLSAQRWVDLSEPDRGVTLTAIDAPLVQLGRIRTDAIITGWDETLAPSGTVYSYAMNNYWETNYLAGQEGPVTLRYTLTPHGGFEEAVAEREARAVAHPLMAVAAPEDGENPGPPFAVDADRAVVTKFALAGDGAGWVVRLYNPGAAADTALVSWRRGVAGRVHESDVWERMGEPLTDVLPLGPYEVRTIRVVAERR